MSLKETGGVWLPENEKHLCELMSQNNKIVNGKLTYQYHKLEMAMEHVTRFRTAIDVGAHCGLWSMHLVDRFDYVEAFEPVELHREAFRMNVKGNYALRECALGETEGSVSMYTADTSSGDTTVAGDGDIPMHRLDDLLDLDDVDFIKLDCEGYELFALKGGIELIKRCKPVICVEQKPGKGKQFGLGDTDAVKWLESIGYTLVNQYSGDYILK